MPDSRQLGTKKVWILFSLLISKGVDIVTVANLAGHSMQSTTINMYAHAISEKKASAVEAIGMAFEGMV